MFDDAKIIVQGITGRQGRFHTKLMKEYGTNIVGGVTPGKGGEIVEGIKVYNSVKGCLEENRANLSVIFVPAEFAKDASIEALRSGLNIVIITEGIPTHDCIEIMKVAKERNLTVIGPNCPGFVVVDKMKVGIMPGNIFSKGGIGIVSRSGTLTYEVVNILTENGIGQHTVVGIGGDKIIGSDFIDILKTFEGDNEIKKIVLIGEIGSEKEEEAAKFIKENVTKKIVAYIAGKTAPRGKRMGHAGAIIMGDKGTYNSKVEALENVGIKVAGTPEKVAQLLK